MTMPFEQWFMFEQSVVKLKFSIFRPMSDAIQRWLWLEDRSSYGLGVNFQILYELENGKFVLLDYHNCLPIFRNQPHGRVPVWQSNYPPVGAYIDPNEALDRLIASQFQIPPSLDPLLQKFTKPESKEGDSPVQVRELSYWSNKGYGDWGEITPAESTDLMATARKISSVAVRFLCEVHHSVKEKSKMSLYEGGQLRQRLFRSYSVDPELWWGKSNEIPPKYVDICGLPWPDDCQRVVEVLGQLKEMFRIPLAFHDPKLKPRHPDYPTDLEYEKIRQAIAESLPAFETLAMGLKTALEEREQSINSECSHGDSKRHDQENSPEEPYLGLIVDKNAKTISRTGFKSQNIDLARSIVEWHLFWICFDAKGRALGVDEMRLNYPGEEENRNSVIHKLNEKLKRFKVKISHRQLVEF